MDLGFVHVKILHPAPDFRASENDLSLVLHLSGPRYTALLTGDIEERGLRQLIPLLQGLTPPLTADILTAPHHGSRNRHSSELKDLIRPAEVWLSARPKFPKETVWLSFPFLRRSWEGEWELGL